MRGINTSHHNALVTSAMIFARYVVLHQTESVDLLLRDGTMRLGLIVDDYYAKILPLLVDHVKKV